MGVVFAIYGFIWVLIELGLAILRSGRSKTKLDEYLTKGVKYLILTDVTFLFCLDIENGEITLYRLVMASFVLLTYFLGKLQKDQRRNFLFKNLDGKSATSTFDLKLEVGLISLNILIFTGFMFYPDYARNPLSLWFRSSILDIENTIIIGFVFKLIGFLFLAGMILKMINGIMFLLSGKPFIQASSYFGTNNSKSENKFDDYEEVE
jgi:hypothetical protein